MPSLRTAVSCWELWYHSERKSLGQTCRPELEGALLPPLHPTHPPWHRDWWRTRLPYSYPSPRVLCSPLKWNSWQPRSWYTQKKLKAISKDANFVFIRLISRISRSAHSISNIPSLKGHWIPHSSLALFIAQYPVCASSPGHITTHGSWALTQNLFEKPQVSKPQLFASLAHG